MKGSEEEARTQERLWHTSELGSEMENRRKEARKLTADTQKVLTEVGHERKGEELNLSH